MVDVVDLQFSVFALSIIFRQRANTLEKFFKVSSKLKQIIGRDLITNDFVAVFELVKNAFDAYASRVDILFEFDRILIADNGKGMTEKELQEKWLFVAYSAKNDGSEDTDLSSDYRSRIRVGRAPAGNKGVGRFSCDRLGSQLNLQTRSERAKTAKAEVLNLNWDKFEEDAKAEFINIPIQATFLKQYEVPSGIPTSPHGTILEINKLREPEEWGRDKLLQLKAQLAKLITPFEDKSRKFSIIFHAKHEASSDTEIKKAIRKETDDSKRDQLSQQLVNGPVENPIFVALLQKTTSIKVEIVAGKKIRTKLIDRGELVYELQESNPFEELDGANYVCEVFYLNLAAKLTFAKRMGIDSANFGSVFLFRNGFRVFPIGELGDDTFGINLRKQQGYNRFLGTRDIIGHISVEGNEKKFREASSRDRGLIQTPAYSQLLSCFQKFAFRRLERYVVDVTWLDPLDKNRDTITGLLQKNIAKGSAIKLISNLVDSADVEVLSYSKNLVQIIDRKVDGFEDSLKRLEIIASKTGNNALLEEIRQASKRFNALKAAALEAEEKSKREAAAREAAEAEAETATREAALQTTRADTAEVAYEEEKKRSLFFESHLAADTESLLEWFHQIDIYSADMDSGLNQLFKLLKKNKDTDRELMKEIVEDVLFKNQKILQVSRLVTKANFRMASEEVEADIVAYIRDYVEKIAAVYQLRSGERFKEIEILDADVALKCKFKPMEVGMAIDNLVSNSQRHGARKLTLLFKQRGSKSIEIEAVDNGKGMIGVAVDINRLFERGYTTTTGAGLGLTLVKRVFVDQLRGELVVDGEYRDGFKLLIRLSK